MKWRNRIFERQELASKLASLRHKHFHSVRKNEADMAGYHTVSGLLRVGRGDSNPHSPFGEADFKFEPIWLQLIADGCGCRNLRTLPAVFVRHRSLLVIRAAVKVAVKSRSDPLIAGHLWGTLFAATMQYEKLHSRRSDRQALRRREQQRLQSGPTL
jgi:hypothetical protein